MIQILLLLSTLGLDAYADKEPCPKSYLGPTDAKKRPVDPKIGRGFLPATHKWWTPLIWKRDGTPKPLYAYPLAFKAQAQGLELGYPNQGELKWCDLEDQYTVEGRSYQFAFQSDLFVTLKHLDSKEASVLDYSDLTVTTEWKDATQSLKATFGQGLPFTYFEVKGKQLVIQPRGKTSLWYLEENAVGISIDDRIYAIFGPTSSSWQITGETIESTLDRKGYFSIAVLPYRSDELLRDYQQAAFTFVKGGDVSWKDEGSSSLLEIQWKVENKEKGKESLLSAFYPHIWKNLKEPVASQEKKTYQYLSPRGAMQVLEGTKIQASYPFYGVMPEIPLQLLSDPEKEQVRKELSEAASRSSEDRWAKLSQEKGKTIHRVVHWIQLAHQLDEIKIRDRFVTELKDVFEKEKNQVFYDPKWKALIPLSISKRAETELENPLSYAGYWVEASATLATFVPEFLRSSGGFVEDLIKNAANWDRKDQRFPYLRGFDAFSAQSWSDGPSASQAGNVVQSTAEAMHFAAALILWGEVAKKSGIVTLGRALYSMQESSIRESVFNQSQVSFPRGFRESALARVRLTGGSSASREETYPQEVFSGNLAPLDGGSFYLGRIPAVYRHLEKLRSHAQSNMNQLKDVYLKTEALFDPTQALTGLEDMEDAIFDVGGSLPHTTAWILSLKQLGKPDTQVVSEYPLSSVFRGEKGRCYTAYNAQKEAKEITFSDGIKLSLEGVSFAVHCEEVEASCSSKKEGDPTPLVHQLEYTIEGDVELYLTDLTGAMGEVRMRYRMGGSQVVFDTPLERTPSGEWRVVIPDLPEDGFLDYSFQYLLKGKPEESDWFHFAF